ncbi:MULTISPECIES: ankyrin repeat domain-containing protein [unclassified Wolbachia]|uniref:ankyrin repeat domain-containing protein n=1 Tax=unclassified Wolbachia TaxID=2640676 RepID=UPI0022265AB7|nr:MULTISPECIES: ankyrin repeat domain-containing protein [unclassified Wolbachia]
MYQEQGNSVSNSRFTLPHIELLSTCKANVNAADHKGATPLHYAACGNRLEEMKLLLKNGASVNAVDYNGATPLHYAACGNRLEEMKLLLKNGANVNAVDNSGFTPLHLSVCEGYREITRLLLGETESPSTSCSDASIENVQTINQFYHW